MSVKRERTEDRRALAEAAQMDSRRDPAHDGGARQVRHRNPM